MAKLLLIVPTNLDIALYGAERFYTDGTKCWALDGHGRPGQLIPWPAWGLARHFPIAEATSQPIPGEPVIHPPCNSTSSKVLFQAPHGSGQFGAGWTITQDPTAVGNTCLVRFRRSNGQRKLCDQVAEWQPRNPAAVARGGVWNYRRWVPKSPIVPMKLIQLVEAQMREVAS